MRLLVYGLGRSGAAVVQRAHGDGHELAFYEARGSGADIDAALALGAKRLSDPLSWHADLCIAAPGVAIDHPHLEALRGAGVEVIGEVEWMARTLPARIVGITGTAGKGSVTRWLEALLQAAGVDAIAGGNVDPALAAVARPGATWVVELSSFQLERCPTLRPDVAVILNLGVDHLDRHGDVASYHAAKRALLANLGPEQVFVFDGADATLRAWARASAARALPFVTSRAAYDAVVHDLALTPAASVHVDDDVLRLGQVELVRAAELSVSGRHQHANALAVALSAAALGVPSGAIREGLRAFRGLAGRYSEVARLGDVRFIDDSIATRELAVAAALEATPAPVVWIAGGVDKGADVGQLAPQIAERVVLTIGIGASGRALCERVAAWSRSVYVDEADGERAIERAVALAYAHLHEHHAQRGTVLLAPLAASFDQFRDYRHRGDAFAAAARQLASATTADASRPDTASAEGGPWTRSS